MSKFIGILCVLIACSNARALVSSFDGLAEAAKNQTKEQKAVEAKKISEEAKKALLVQVLASVRDYASFHPKEVDLKKFIQDLDKQAENSNHYSEDEFMTASFDWFSDHRSFFEDASKATDAEIESPYFVKTCSKACLWILLADERGYSLPSKVLDNLATKIVADQVAVYVKKAKEKAIKDGLASMLSKN